MKSKIRVIKSDNTMVVDYLKVKEPIKFRYNMLIKVLEKFDEAIMFMNTNTKTGESASMIEEYFEKNNVDNAIVKIQGKERTIFGMSLKAFKKQTPKLNEKFIMAKVNKEMFTREFFDEYLATYDIALAFGSKLNVAEIKEEYREGIQGMYFDKEYFEEFLYDSILFKSFRSTIDVRDNVADCE